MEREYSDIEIIDSRTPDAFVDSDHHCANCRKSGEELYQLPAVADDEGWYCADCYAESMMILEAEATCGVLYSLVCQAKSVAQVAELMAEHVCEACRVPGRRPVSSVKTDSNSQMEVA